MKMNIMILVKLSIIWRLGTQNNKSLNVWTIVIMHNFNYF